MFKRTYIRHQLLDSTPPPKKAVTRTAEFAKSADMPPKNTSSAFSFCPALLFLQPRIARLAALLFVGLSLRAFAGSATWNTNPGTNSWNTAANWTPTTVPHGPEDLASFNVSNVTDLTLDTDIDLAGMIFQSGGSAYTLILPLGSTLNFLGDGITNDSEQLQSFLLSIRKLNFHNRATAGSETLFQAGQISFYDNATAGEATFETTASLIEFHDNSSADHGTFINGGSHQPDHTINGISFFDQSSAGEGYFVDNASTPGLENNGPLYIGPAATADAATVVNMAGTFVGALPGTMTVDGTGANGTFSALGSEVAGAAGGQILVFGNADNASYTAIGGSNGGNGGILFFSQGTQGGTARCTVLGNATMKMGTTDGIGLSIGSLEGDGLVFITTLGFGEKQLTVGTNNLDTTFSGVIGNGIDQAASAGSLLKTGSATFTLTGENTYTGGTIVQEGKLIVAAQTGYTTGPGRVRVDGGTLGGTGVIEGRVRVGTAGTSAFLSPGITGVGMLELHKDLVFAGHATYDCEIDTDKSQADVVSAKKVIIQSPAMFSLTELGTATLPIGTAFRVIEMKHLGPIVGTFANLPDGTVITAGSNLYQASYAGGDGNDLTLTVVP